MVKPELAPIGIPAYVRVDHIRKCIAALTQNDLAKESHLYVFSDGPRLGDEQLVEDMRAYLRTVDGFGDYTLVERKANIFPMNNRGGHRELLNRHGRMIWMEEDIVPAPGYLTFMNAALNRYKRDERITSICGYCPPFNIPDNLGADCFAMPRFNAWGIGIWADRYSEILPPDLNDYRSVLRRVGDFSRAIGWDAVDLLRREVNGELDALDVKIMYHNWANRRNTVYPAASLVQNIGHDGSGIHCPPSSRFDVPLSSNRSFLLPSRPMVDSRILKANYHFRNVSARRRRRYRYKQLVEWMRWLVRFAG